MPDPTGYTAWGDIAAAEDLDDDSTLLIDGGAYSVADTRSLLMLPARSIFVPMSGDETGATDYDNIAAAIATAQTAGGIWTVFLAGTYYVDEPIELGDRADHDSNCCNLHGIGRGATIYYTGAQTSEYLIRVSGRQNGTWDRLANLRLEGAGNCRGLLLNRQDSKAVRQVHIHNMREMGLDVVNCWSGTIQNIMITYVRGMGLRVWESHDVRLDKIYLGNVWGSWHTTSGTRVEMWLYEMENGRDATIAEYGASYNESWPATDDETVVDYESDYVRTPQSKQAACYISSRYATLRNITMESNAEGQRPLIYIDWYSQNISIDRVYMELNYAGSCKFYLNGTSTAAGGTNNFRFQDILSEDKQAALTTECLIRTAGFTSNVSVQNVRASDLGSAVVMCDGGTHYLDGTIAGIKSTANTISPANWVQAENGGVLVASNPYAVVHDADYLYTSPLKLPIFANAAAREAAWTAPAAGWTCWLTDPGALTIYDGSNWKVISVDGA